MLNRRRIAAAVVFSLLWLTALPVRASEIVELSLADCLALAAESNAQLKLAVVGFDKAKLQLKETKGDVKKLKELDDLGFSLPTDLDTKFFKDYGVWLSEEQLALAQASRDLAEEGARLATTNAYYDLLKADADLKTALAAEKEAAEARRAAAAQLKVGLLTPAQDLAAETGLALARAGRLGAESMRESKRLTLLKETGLPGGTDPVLILPAPGDEQFSLEETVAAALAASIDLRAARLQRDVAEKTFALTKKRYPSITYQYKKAEYAYLESELRLTEAELAAEIAVRTSYNLYLAADGQLLPARRAIEQAEENLKLVKARLAVGAATALEVLTAERGLAQAESNYVGIAQGRAMAAAALAAAEKGLISGAARPAGGKQP